MAPPRSRNGAIAPLAASLALALPIVLSAQPVRALDEGDSAPGFSVPMLSGPGQLSLDRFRGKVVYLDFWASWCPPCLTSLPLLEELRGEYPEDRFQVLAVNVDDDPDAGRRMLAKLKVSYPSGTDPEGRVPERFELTTMPTSFLIDESGVIRYVHEGFRKGDLPTLRARIDALVDKGR